MQKIDKGFIILTKDGEILATEDRQEMIDYTNKPTNAIKIYAYPNALIDDLEPTCPECGYCHGCGDIQEECTCS